MSKFKFKLKLQGLELEMEGAREDIPLMAQNLGNQLTGLLQPAADMASNDKGREEEVALPLTIDHSSADKARTKRRRKFAGSESAASNGEAPTIEWQHDPAKYGNPQQAWNVVKKAIWMIYVLSKETAYSQVSAKQTADTFNKKFKQAGTIRSTNVSRDPGKAKPKSPALVGGDTSKAVVEWFLTNTGTQFAEDSIKEVTQPNAAN